MLKKIYSILIVIALIASIITGHENFIFRYGLLYLIMMIGVFNFTYIFKKNSSQTIPFWFLVTFIYLYLFSLIDRCLLGIYSYVLISFIVFVIIIVKSIKNGRNDAIKDFFHPGFYVFSTLYIIFAFFSRNGAFAVWDEYATWSLVSKNMYYNDSLYLTGKTTVYCFYPPFPTILQYFFCKLLGKYSQGIELFTCYMLGFSLMMPLLKNIKKTELIKILSILLCMIFIPCIFADSLFYYTIYTDTLLGIMTGYILYEYFFSDNDRFLKITMFFAFACLSLLKTTGILTAIIIIFVLFIYNSFDIKEKRIKVSKINKKNICIFIILFISIFLSYITWRIYSTNNSSNLNYGYRISVAPRSLLEVVKLFYHTIVGTTEPINATFSTFFRDFFDKGYYVLTPFGMPGSCVIAIFMLSYIYVLKSFVSKKEKNKYIKIFVSILLVFLFYIIMIQFAYAYRFSDAEAVSHASMQRYVGTIYTTLLILLIGIVYNLNHKSKMYLFVVPIILLIFTPVNNIANATVASGYHYYKVNQKLKPYSEFSDFVKAHTTKKSKIFPINQANDESLIIFRYFMTPVMVPMVDHFNNDIKYYLDIKNVKEFEKLLYDDYDYVVILKTDDFFNENYNDIFEKQKIENFSLYKINKRIDNSIVLKKIE